GDDAGAGVVPVEQLVVLGDPVAVRVVVGAGEAPPPGPAVPADLAERLDHQRVPADALLDRRQLARLDQLRQLGRFLEALRELGGIGDDLRAFQLADEVRARLGPLGRGRPRRRRRGHGQEPEAQQAAPGQSKALSRWDSLGFCSVAHEGSPFRLIGDARTPPGFEPRSPDRCGRTAGAPSSRPVAHARVARGPAQLWRRISSRAIAASGPAPGRPPISSRSRRAAAWPSSYRGTRTVVSAGVTRLAYGTSSQPTM